MKKLRQYKFSKGSAQHGSEYIVHFFDAAKTYDNGDSFVIPNMASFIHDVSEFGNVGALKKRLFKLNILQLLRLMWWNKFSLISIAKKEFHAGVLLLVQIELLQLLKYKPGMIILSDQINDISYSLGNRQILAGVQRLLTKKLGLIFGIMTNNLTVSVNKLDEWRIKPAMIFTPFNRFGYEMNPNQKSVEDIVPMIDATKIVAISPELENADREYLKQHGISHVMTHWF